MATYPPGSMFKLIRSLIGLEKNLVRYKIPKDYFVLDELPKNIMGKGVANPNSLIESIKFFNHIK